MSFTVALRGQTHSKTKGKKTQNVQNATEVFLGDNNMLEELPKWQANSKWLIANICLQCYMNYAIKTHITCIFFLPNNTDESSASIKPVSVQYLY